MRVAAIISMAGAATSQGAAVARVNESILSEFPLAGLPMNWGDILLTSSAAIGIIVGLLGIWRFFHPL